MGNKPFKKTEDCESQEGGVAGSKPAKPELGRKYTRYDLVRQQPPEILRVLDLVEGNVPKCGWWSDKYGIFPSSIGHVSRAYQQIGARDDLYRFLVNYGVVGKVSGGRRRMGFNKKNADRLRNAIVKQTNLEYIAFEPDSKDDDVVKGGTVPVTLTLVAPEIDVTDDSFDVIDSTDETDEASDFASVVPANAPLDIDEPEPENPLGIAYLTPKERDAFDLVTIMSRNTTLASGAFRCPVTREDAEFHATEAGQLFAGGREEFVKIVERFARAGFVKKIKETGPEGIFDAYEAVIPLSDIVVVPIVSRPEIFVEEDVLRAFPSLRDEIVCAFEENGELDPATLVEACITRVMPWVDATLFACRVVSYHPSNIMDGWGLVRTDMGERALVCAVEFMPVTFALPPAEDVIIINNITTAAPSAPIKEGPMDLTTLTDTELLAQLEALQLEAARRSKAAIRAKLEGEIVEIDSRLAGKEHEATAKRELIGRLQAELEVLERECGAFREQIASKRQEIAAL